MQKKEFEKKIIFRAIRDEKFRKELEKDPRKVIEKELKITLPKDLHIAIHQQKANEWHLVIPAVSNTERLSDADLTKIAGGEFPETCPEFNRGCR